MLKIHGADRTELISVFVDIVEDALGANKDEVVVDGILFDKLYDQFEDALVVNKLIDTRNEEDEQEGK